MDAKFVVFEMISILYIYIVLYIMEEYLTQRINLNLVTTYAIHVDELVNIYWSHIYIL